MKNWSDIFSSCANSGVYAISSTPDMARIEHSSRVYGFAFIYIDLSGIQTKDGFLRIVSRALKFPDYFGMNWDAFEECLTDMSWFASKGYILVIDNLEEFTYKVPRELKIARNIFESAAKHWREQELSFFVLLVNEKDKSSDK